MYNKIFLCAARKLDRCEPESTEQSEEEEEEESIITRYRQLAAADAEKSSSRRPRNRLPRDRRRSAPTSSSGGRRLQLGLGRGFSLSRCRPFVTDKGSLSISTRTVFRFHIYYTQPSNDSDY